MASSRLLVAAIDIGTTYSGYAFSFKHDKDAITTNKIWKAADGDRVSYKTPTVVLVDQQEQFHSFGYEAEDMYTRLAADNQHKPWYYFKRFKMALYKEENLSRYLSLPSAGGKSMNAMTVFAMSIRYLKNHLLGVIGEQVREADVQFVLTVPAIWSESAKQFMREAAGQAGIDNEHVTVSLEPETASIYCRTLSPWDIREVSPDATGTLLNISAPGSRYMVVDAGGGTVDITVHQVEHGDKLKELHRASGGDWGGANVDDAFTELLMKLFTPKVVKTFAKEHRADRLELERDFESQKQNVSSKKENMISVRMPSSLIELVEYYDVQIADAGFGQKIGMLGDKLRVSSEVMRSLFSPTCDKIIDHVRCLFSDSRCHGVSTILMVGGFSQSPMLQERMYASFLHCRVVTPVDPALAVMKGAVMFGHVPDTISTRLSTYTYGIASTTNFIEGVHDIDHYKVIEGEGMCMDTFTQFIKLNEESYAGKKSRKMSFHPVYTGQKSISLSVYRSTKVSPFYTTDSSCTYVGNLIVPMPDLTGDKNREVRVRVMFGGTEMTVKAHEVTTGKDYQAKLDFLAE